MSAMTAAGRETANGPTEARPGNGAPEAPGAALPGVSGASRGIFEPQPDPASLGIRPEDIIRHGSCGRWWTGPARNHCGRCHITTSSLAAFDAHQRGGACQHPATGGLVPHRKPWGTLWALPIDEDGLARLKSTRGAPGGVG